MIFTIWANCIQYERGCLISADNLKILHYYNEWNVHFISRNIDALLLDKATIRYDILAHAVMDSGMEFVSEFLSRNAPSREQDI